MNKLQVISKTLISAEVCYFLGFYFTGDGALRDIDGDYRITGRMDDVINVSGKRLGTAEIEDALVTGDVCWTGSQTSFIYLSVFFYYLFLTQDNHEAVAETAVVGFPHPIKGEGKNVLFTASVLPHGR